MLIGTPTIQQVIYHNERKVKMAEATSTMMEEIQESQKLMGRLQVSGFPTLIIEKDGQFVRLPHSSYYGKPAEWEAYLVSLT